MKKFLALALAVIMALTLIACGEKPPPPPPPPPRGGGGPPPGGGGGVCTVRAG